MSQLYGLTPRSKDQLARLFADGGGVGGRASSGSAARGVTWVKVTGPADGDGWYPGVVSLDRAGVWVDLTAPVKVQPADGAGLSVGRHLCTRTGDTGEGVACYRATRPGSVLVQCTSTTPPATSSGYNSPYYPAVVVDLYSVAAGRPVWLKVLQGTLAITPTQNQTYSCVLSGSYDPRPGKSDSDERPCVVAAAAAALPYGNASGAGSYLTTDFQTVASANLPSAGIYLIFARFSGMATLYAQYPQQGVTGEVGSRVFNSAAGSSAYTFESFFIATSIPAANPFASHVQHFSSCASFVFAAGGPTALALQAWRNSSNSWGNCLVSGGVSLNWVCLTGLNRSDPGGITVDLE